MYRQSDVTLIRGRVYAFRDRRVRKREFRKLWIVRINAACRITRSALHLTEFIAGLQRANVELDRKSRWLTSPSANPDTFTKIVELAKALEPAARLEIKVVSW